jgi:hypothetical protein
MSKLGNFLANSREMFQLLCANPEQASPRVLRRKVQEQAEQIEKLQRARYFQAAENAFTLRDRFFEPDQWLRQARDLHRGERCFLLGCGPSLRDLDPARLAGQCVMGTNGTYLIDGLELDYYVTVSHYFYKNHIDGLKRMRCSRRFLPHYIAGDLESDCPTSVFNSLAKFEHMSYLQEAPLSFSHDPSELVFLGGTVIFACLQILYWLGFSEVVLLGVDHDYGTSDEDNSTARVVLSSTLNAHFIDDYYPETTRVHLDFPSMERAYRLGREAFDRDGRRVLNATPGSKLETFEKVALDNILSPQYQ